MTLSARYYAPTGLVGAACAAEGGSSCYRFYVATLRSSPPRRCAGRLTPRLSLHCTWRSQVCRALVPGWSCVPNAVLSITVIDGGLTNRLFRCARTTAPLFSPADAAGFRPCGTVQHPTDGVSASRVSLGTGPRVRRGRCVHPTAGGAVSVHARGVQCEAGLGGVHWWGTAQQRMQSSARVPAQQATQ